MTIVTIFWTARRGAADVAGRGAGLRSAVLPRQGTCLLPGGDLQSCLLGLFWCYRPRWWVFSSLAAPRCIVHAAAAVPRRVVVERRAMVANVAVRRRVVAATSAAAASLVVTIRPWRGRPGTAATEKAQSYATARDRTASAAIAGAAVVWHAGGMATPSLAASAAKKLPVAASLVVQPAAAAAAEAAAADVRQVHVPPYGTLSAAVPAAIASSTGANGTTIHRGAAIRATNAAIGSDRGRAVIGRRMSIPTGWRASRRGRMPERKSRRCGDEWT